MTQETTVTNGVLLRRKGGSGNGVKITIVNCNKFRTKCHDFSNAVIVSVQMCSKRSYQARANLWGREAKKERRG